MIDLDFKRVITLRGVKMRIELEPSCWVGKSPLGILVRGNTAGAATFNSPRLFDDASEADLEKLIKTIKLVGCTHPKCKRLVLVGVYSNLYNETVLCEPHRMAEIRKRGAIEKAKEDAKKAARDAKAKAKGFRYKTRVWIHRDDRDDFYMLDYHRKRPTKAALDKIAKKCKSRLLGDYSIDKL